VAEHHTKRVQGVGSIEKFPASKEATTMAYVPKPSFIAMGEALEFLLDYLHPCLMI
jgi:hypothetical protein